ncbi:MAG: magnesium/cobalt transporter CorA [Candidatus Neomarinimicrobiota bacterium]|jgi:magnesium transporter|nr:magnesium/cobalt transporter CorA [Candidatus Neomarinimicrobiota bacterium]MDD3965648.1 magnesium/cobalt transporter CorA [Candidatus Neomarinimicrobiota bacterium]MDX9781028.1 magnesium/cobalt transporter CorA [bacterium]
MARFIKDKTAAYGLAPGEAVFIGTKKVDMPSLHVIDYHEETLEESHPENIDDIRVPKDRDSVSWINLYGVHDPEMVKSLADKFNLHPLVPEDIVNTGQRPKMEVYDDHLFFVLKMMHYNDKENRIYSEQLSIVLGDRYLLTFQERPGDVFQPLRTRLRKQIGRIRSERADYLAYSILDAVVDNYILLVERVGEKIEDLEVELLGNPGRKTLTKINDYKREMNYLRKSIRPAKEFIQQLSRQETELFRDSTRPFLKDLQDIATQALETVDTYRIMLTDHLDIYNSSISNRLNEIMKVLTIFSAIFIPLTFIAGVYGTNFVHMPELQWRFAYPVFWGVLIVVAILMLRFFKRKKWL